MRKLRKIIAFALTLFLLAGISVLGAAAAEPPETTESPDTITVSLRIESIEEMIYYNKAIELAEGATLEDLMMLAAELDETLGIVITGSSFGGTYIPEIAGIVEGEYGGYSGWSFIVSGFAPEEGQSNIILADDDDVVYYYGDPWGDAGMQYPIPDLSRLYSDGIISFTSEDDDWDEDFNKTTSLNPVVGAVVTFNGAEYTTDANGEIEITDMTGVTGMQSLQIERYDETSGLPTVLRFAPDYAMYVPFADVPDGEWFDFPIEYCVRAGYFAGIGQNRFAPRDKMTIAQLFTVLARIAGIDPALMTGDEWYVASLNWAFETDLINVKAMIRGDFSDFETMAEYALNTYVTREEFIHMFHYTIEKIGDFDMTAATDISEAADYDLIDEDYYEAISWAVASGIIKGTTSDVLTIDPNAEINRAEVCQMLLNYYN